MSAVSTARAALVFEFAFGVVLWPAFATGQTSTSGEQHVGITSAGTIGTYEGRYGKPQWVSLENIARGEAPLSGALRTIGMLQVERADHFDHSSPMTYALVSRDAMEKRAKLFICPVPEIEDNFVAVAESLRFREVEVVGTPDPQGSDACRRGSAGFVFWSYAVVEPKPPAAGPSGDVTPIGSILEDADRFRRRTVKVVGQFRGRNLFGDVPAGEVPAEGWLIKDSGALLWIVGHEPRGKGFALDPLSEADGKWWVQVTGTPETREGRVVFRAREILALSHAPHP